MQIAEFTATLPDAPGGAGFSFVNPEWSPRIEIHSHTKPRFYWRELLAVLAPLAGFPLKQMRAGACAHSTVQDSGPIHRLRFLFCPLIKFRSEKVAPFSFRPSTSSPWCSSEPACSSSAFSPCHFGLPRKIGNVRRLIQHMYINMNVSASESI